MAEELSQAQIEKVSASLGEKLQAVIDGEPSLSGYQIETLDMSKREEASKGLATGCKLECKVQGFPPKVKCKIVCET